MRQTETTGKGFAVRCNGFIVSKKVELNFIMEKVKKGILKTTYGKYKCRCVYKVVGLTEQATKDFNKLLAKGVKQ